MTSLEEAIKSQKQGSQRAIEVFASLTRVNRKRTKMPKEQIRLAISRAIQHLPQISVGMIRFFEAHNVIAADFD